MRDLKKYISKFSSKKILVIGDVILDRYIEGVVSRISPEAPVPVVLEKTSFFTPGGAANVAYNLKSLGATVFQVGRIGNDFEGQYLKRLLKKREIHTNGIFLDQHIPTITKTRVIAQHQQIVRIDKEKSNNRPDGYLVKKIRNYISKQIASCDAVIISDYGKGLITAELVDFIHELAQKQDIIITVDPKVEHFGYYRQVTGITPNKKETENAIRNIKIYEQKGNRLKVNKDRLESNKDIDLAGEQLLQFLDLESLLITLGEEGMRLYEKGKKPYVIPTCAREVFDVSGAGDTVIAVFTLALTAGANKRQAAELANQAAGIVVGKMGAVAITKDELSDAI